MFKFSEKLVELNLEQKLLLTAVSIIPMFALAIILNFMVPAILIAIWELFIPLPKIYFSNCGPYPPSLPGYILLSLINLALASIFTLYQKHLLLIISLLMPLILIILRSFYIYSWYQENYKEPPFNTFFESVDLPDLIFFLIVLSLLIWQISILFRGLTHKRNPLLQFR